MSSRMDSGAFFLPVIKSVGDDMRYRTQYFPLGLDLVSLQHRYMDTGHVYSALILTIIACCNENEYLEPCQFTILLTSGFSSNICFSLTECRLREISLVITL